MKIYYWAHTVDTQNVHADLKKHQIRKTRPTFNALTNIVVRRTDKSFSLLNSLKESLAGELVLLRFRPLAVTGGSSSLFRLFSFCLASP